MQARDRCEETQGFHFLKKGLKFFSIRIIPVRLEPPPRQTPMMTTESKIKNYNVSTVLHPCILLKTQNLQFSNIKLTHPHKVHKDLKQGQTSGLEENPKCQITYDDRADN